MKKYSESELTNLYQEASTIDQAIFAEMRNNSLLVNGEHFQRLHNELYDRIKNTNMSEATKLKITFNYIQLVTKVYKNSILNGVGDVKVFPHNPKENADIKDAQISDSVKQWAKQDIKFDKLKEELVNDYVDFGEMIARIYFDPNKGRLIGYEQKVDLDGSPLFLHPELGEVPVPTDMLGQPLEPVADKNKPKMSGQICAEKIFPYNFKRDPSAETFEECRWFVVDRYVDESEAIGLISELPEDEREQKEKLIKGATGQHYTTFNANNGKYADKKGKVFLQEWYFKPCQEYPSGAFFLRTNDSTLLGPIDLPNGVFPIVYETFDRISGSVRGSSIIRPMRPVQVEISRLASQGAANSIVHGDTKIVTQYGSKLEKVSSWAGIKHLQVNGNAPTIIPGQSGETYDGAINNRIQTLFQIVGLDFLNNEKTIQDPIAMLYASAAQKEKFNLYSRKAERFFCNFWMTYLQIAKIYLPDDEVIRVNGKAELVNLPEFRRSRETGFDIKCEPVSSDIYSSLGRFLQSQQLLQYVGKELPKHALGGVIKSLEFLNSEKAFSRLTVQSDNLESDLLQLDRGEYVPARLNDDHDLFIEGIEHRMRQGDFKFMPEPVKQMYQQRLKEHYDIKAEQLAEQMRIQQGLIPTGGSLIKVNMYDEETKKQMLLPDAALKWLVEQLKVMGVNQEVLHNHSTQTQREILDRAQQLAQQMNQQQPMDQQQPTQPPQAIM